MVVVMFNHVFYVAGQLHKKATMVLNPVISKLVGKLVVLASASPRRMEILRNAVRKLPHQLIHRVCRTTLKNAPKVLTLAVQGFPSVCVKVWKVNADARL